MYTETDLEKKREDAHKIIEKGREWYKRYAQEIEGQHKGEFIVIEVESGEYVIADDDVKVLRLARETFGSKPRYFSGIGFQYSVHG